MQRRCRSSDHRSRRRSDSDVGCVPDAPSSCSCAGAMVPAQRNHVRSREQFVSRMPPLRGRHGSPGRGERFLGHGGNHGASYAIDMPNPGRGDTGTHAGCHGPRRAGTRQCLSSDVACVPRRTLFHARVPSLPRSGTMFDWWTIRVPHASAAWKAWQPWQGRTVSSPWRQPWGARSIRNRAPVGPTPSPEHKTIVVFDAVSVDKRDS